MAVPLQQCTKQEQRSVVRFLFSEGVKPIEIHRRMRIQYLGVVRFHAYFRAYLVYMNTGDSNILWPFLQHANEGLHMNILEHFCTQLDIHQNKLMPKQHAGDRIPLFDLVCDLQQQHATAWHNKQVLQNCVYVLCCSIGLATTTKTYSSPDMVCKNDYCVTYM
jgi:hypothetical protein